MGFCLQCGNTEQSAHFNVSYHGDECDQCIKDDDPEAYVEWVDGEKLKNKREGREENVEIIY